MKIKKNLYNCCIFLLPLYLVVIQSKLISRYNKYMGETMSSLFGIINPFVFHILISIIPAILFFIIIKFWEQFKKSKSTIICLLSCTIFIGICFVSVILYYYGFLRIAVPVILINNIKMITFFFLMYLLLLIDSYKAIKVKIDINNNLEEQENIEIKE